MFSEDVFVRFDIYDATGRIVKNLMADNIVSGNHTLKFDLESDNALSDGVYFIRLKTSDFQAAEKLIIRR